MTTLAIPKELTRKGELVVISRQEYEKLLKFQERYKEIDRDLDEAISQVTRNGFWAV